MEIIDRQYKMPELLCCPFCGQDVEMHYLRYDGLGPMYWVSCPDCSATIKNVSTTEKEAKDVWNRREAVRTMSKREEVIRHLQIIGAWAHMESINRAEMRKVEMCVTDLLTLLSEDERRTRKEQKDDADTTDSEIHDGRGQHNRDGCHP